MRGVIRPVFEVLVPVFGLAGIGSDEEVDVFAGEVAVQVVRQVKGVHGSCSIRGTRNYSACPQSQLLSRLAAVELET